MSNNLNIPTPITDAHMESFPFSQRDYFDIVTQEKMQDLERKLAAARNALQEIADQNEYLTVNIAEHALKQIEP